MEKIDIIKKAEELIQPEILYGTVSSSGKRWMFKTYMETEMINNIKENVLPERIAEYIKTNLISKIIPNNHINELFEIINSPDFIDEMPISATEVRSNKNALCEYAEKMDQDGKILIGPNKKTLKEIYQMLLRDRYIAPTYEDKVETCTSMFYDYIAGIQDENIQKAIRLDIEAPNVGKMPYSEYITQYIPKNMPDATTVKINGKIYDLDYYVELTIKRQLCKYLASTIKKEILDSMLDKGNGRMVRTQEYIEEELPNFMDTFTTFKFGSNVIGINETLEQIVKTQEEVLKNEAERDKINQEAKNNNRGEPLLVPTIVLNTKNGQITAEEQTTGKLDGIHQGIQEPLTTSEREVLRQTGEVIKTDKTDDGYYNTLINNILDAIRNCKSLKEIEEKELEIKSLISGAEKTILSPTTKANAEYALDQIEMRKKFLMILENNTADYQASIKEFLLNIKLVIEGNEVRTNDELAFYEKEINEIKKEMIAKNIDNRELDVLITQIKRKLTITGKTVGMLEKKKEKEHSLI